MRDDQLMGELDLVDLYMSDVSDHHLLNHREEVELAKTIEGHESVLRFKSEYSDDNQREPTGETIALWLIDRILGYEALLRAFATRNGLAASMSLAQILTSYPFLVALEKPLVNETRLNAGRLRCAWEYVKPLPLHEIDKIAASRSHLELRDLRDDPQFVRQLAANNRALTAHFDRVVTAYREAYHRLTQANLRLVVHVATNHVGKGLPLLDLVQEGYIGLHRAVSSYDYRLGYRFSTYAYWWIRQSIVRSIADCARTIRIPVHMVETMNRLASTKNRLAEKLCRDPTPSEIGQVIGLSNQQVQQITNFSHAPISLESLVTATAGGDVYDLTEDQNSLSLTESTDARNLRGRLESLITIDEDGYVDYLIQDLDSGSVAKETDMRFLRERIQVVLSTLTDRERQVILLRFGLSDGWARTLEEIGRELDRTRERIRQIEARALGKLRHPSRARRLKGFLNGP